MNATGEKYQDKEVKENYIKCALNQVVMLPQLQCVMLVMLHLSCSKYMTANAVEDDVDYISESSSGETDW